MSQLIRSLAKQKLCTPPKWLADNTMYLCQMGSVAYGVATEYSDVDIYGFAMPPKNNLFVPLNVSIPGFDKLERFEQWQQHHINDKSAGKEYDFNVNCITKYFFLTSQCNPNMIDSLFVPRNCVLHSTAISERVRENRHIFLHKGAWQKFKGYAYSQLHKMNIKKPDPTSKRYESYMEHGYDLKFAYHVVRLLNEVEQILVEGDLDLQRNREQIKSIRRGEWTKEQIIKYAEDKERFLEEAYIKSELPHRPDMDRIRGLLFDCLEMHYDLKDTVSVDVSAETKLNKIQDILNGVQ